RWMPLASSAEASVSPAKPASEIPSKVKRSGFLRSMRPPEGVRNAFTRHLARRVDDFEPNESRRRGIRSLRFVSSLAELRPRLADPVRRQDLVAPGVAKTVEEAGAAVDVPPAFGVEALRVGAGIEEIGPGDVVELRRAPRPGDMGL